MTYNFFSLWKGKANMCSTTEYINLIPISYTNLWVM